MTTIKLYSLTEKEALALMTLCSKVPGIPHAIWGKADEVVVKADSGEAADLYLACAKDIVDVTTHAAVVLGGAK